MNLILSCQVEEYREIQAVLLTGLKKQIYYEKQNDAEMKFIIPI